MPYVKNEFAAADEPAAVAGKAGNFRRNVGVAARGLGRRGAKSASSAGRRPECKGRRGSERAAESGVEGGFAGKRQEHQEKRRETVPVGERIEGRSGQNRFGASAVAGDGAKSRRDREACQGHKVARQGLRARRAACRLAWYPGEARYGGGVRLRARMGEARKIFG